MPKRSLPAILSQAPYLLLSLVLTACSEKPHPPSGYGPTPRLPHNTLAPTPPMGWNSWNRFGCDINEVLIREMADALVDSGMLEAGYTYLNVDDCWQTSRAADGTIVADPLSFPHGIPELARYVHSKGLKFGVYSDVGDQTCQQRPGSLDHEMQDAKTYADWGVDYVKVDWCHSTGLNPREQYAKVHDALAQSGRDIVHSICNWGVDEPWEWGPRAGNLWRTTPDISDSWGSVTSIVDDSAKLAAVAGPSHWNDPDVLEVGNGGMTDGEYRAHFSLWAMMAAPLIAGNDVRTLKGPTRDTLLNPDVIAVDQDVLGIQGARVKLPSSGLEIWSRPLAPLGERAVALFNRTGAAAEITVAWSDVGLADGMASVRDLWTHEELGPKSGYSVQVPSHGVVMLRIRGAERLPPSGTSSLGDLVFRHVADGQGLVARDRSVGGEGTGTGGTLTLGAKTFARGLGVHAESSLRLWLGGRCTAFHATVGVDREVGADAGSVRFEARADGQVLANTPVMTSASDALPLQLDLRGRLELELRVTGAGDTTGLDHADWAEAQLVCN